MTQGHVSQTKQNTQIIALNFPVIYLDSSDYKISVRMINIESADNIQDQYFSLRSTIVDKNAINPNQELYNFRSNGSNYIFCEPTHLREYKVQLKDIHTAEFKLTSSEIVDFNIYEIKILFEISRDARIQ